jgi:hypothetical protein
MHREATQTKLEQAEKNSHLTRRQLLKKRKKKKKKKKKKVT